MPADNRVLIIDSNAASRKRLASALSGLGYAVTPLAYATSRIVEDGESFATVVAVVRGALLDNAAQIADLRARLPRSAMIVVGRRSLDLVLAAWHAGADDYVPRPVRDGDLLAALEHIERSRVARIAQLDAAPHPLADMAGMHTYLRGLARQIANHVTPILGMAELLLEDLPLGHPSREYAQLIIDSAVRVRDLVWHLADLAWPGE
jgi:DNA-binding response OmpR family regulator